MMDCKHYRRAILAEPHSDAADLRLHLATCPDCPRYAEALRRFDARLERALRVGAKPASDRVVVPFRARGGRGITPRIPRPWLAAAASVMLGLVIAGGLWLAAPQSSLAAAVVSHLAEEPDAWSRTAAPVPQPRLDQVMRESHVRLKADAGMVSYANSCGFHGHHVPHLVVQTGAGPVTVMVLVHEPARSKMRFDDHGYRGVIVPIPGHGSIAVLERGPAADIKDVEAVAARVVRALEWES